MMRTWLLTLISFGVLNAAPISAPLVEVENDRAAIVAENLKIGMSGFILRKFDDTHSSIIANAKVEQFNAANNRAILRISEYDGVHQDSLPKGNWIPQASDTALIASDYDRAMLIAPNDDAYFAISKSVSGIEWIHPDQFATYLSNKGHPTPLVEDFHDYCTANSIGLLYIQSAQTLFTLDCKTFSVLENTSSVASSDKTMLPFYSRIPSIRAAWWGEGSSPLESYDPYYLENIALNNSKNRPLYEFFKAKFSEESALLRNFDVKE